MLTFVLFWLPCLLLGAVAGTMAGLLGVGGGLIIVPVLAGLFATAGVASEVIMHLAIGTSLATIVVTSLGSIWGHHRHGAVLWPVVGRLSAGILLGAWLGAWLAAQLVSDVLHNVFAVFELLIALQMASGWRPQGIHALPGRLGMTTAGMFIGAVSSVIGIGGGSLTVPFLSGCRVQIQQAVASSAACGLPIAVAGSLGYIVQGYHHAALPNGSLGYVHGPSLLAITTTSVVFAPLGAWLAHRLPTLVLKRLFAVFLAGLGLYMLIFS